MPCLCAVQTRQARNEDGRRDAARFSEGVRLLLRLQHSRPTHTLHAHTLHTALRQVSGVSGLASRACGCQAKRPSVSALRSKHHHHPLHFSLITQTHTRTSHRKPPAKTKRTTTMLKVKLRHLNVLEGELNAASEDALRVSERGPSRGCLLTFLRACLHLTLTSFLSSTPSLPA